METRSYDKCPNCASELQKGWKFCPGCGQENIDLNVPFRLVLVDLLGDIFTFDSKLFRSLVPFLFRPGEMTDAYLHGRRERYMPPLRILIFLCILLFAVLSRMASTADWESDGLIIVSDRSGLSADTAATSADSLIESEMINLDLNLRKDTLTRTKERQQHFQALLGQIPELSATLKPEAVVDSLLGSRSAEKDRDKIIFNTFISKRRVLLQATKAYQSGGAGVVSFIIANGTITILIAVFMLAMVLKLMYFTQHKNFIAHFVYSTHSHAALVFVGLIYALLIMLFDINARWIFLLLMPYYFFSLKKVYKSGFWVTLTSLLFISFIYNIFFVSIFLVGTIGISFLFF